MTVKTDYSDWMAGFEQILNNHTSEHWLDRMIRETELEIKKEYLLGAIDWANSHPSTPLWSNVVDEYEKSMVIAKARDQRDLARIAVAKYKHKIREILSDYSKYLNKNDGDWLSAVNTG